MPDSENKHAITLLYVEDDDQVRDTMTSILSDEVETVYSAADGQEGLELFQKHPVDLVITDIKMPRMDGLQMSEAIRREADHTPIIVTTAFSDSDVLLDAIEVQVDKFLLKPIRMRQLLGEVSKFAKQIESVRLLREEQYRAAQYLEAIDIGSGVVRFGNDYVISHTNEIFCEMASIKCDNLIGKMVGDLFGEEQQQRLGEILSEYERYEGVASVTVNGYERRMILSCVPIRNERREVEEYVLFVNDLTDYLQMKEQLITNLYTDPLTGLPNLRRLKQRLQIEKPEAMGMVHIDRIGHINNVYGREAGDQVITQMVELLQGHCGDDREVFRIEGDKFAIIPDYAPEENECNVRMQQLVDKIEDFNFRYRDIEFHVNCSAVCVRQPVPNLFAAAEMALDDIRQNKLKYRCNHDFDNMFHRSELNIASYEMLRRAIDRSELQAYYQPIMALENREIVKYEVLARVVNGDGVHSPGGFMEAAKSSRLYHRLTETILRQSLESYASHGKHFSINLSILDIDHDPTRYMLRHLATEYPDAIKKMTIEITEEEGVENFSEVENFCHEMHDLGVSIAIDDFGKGYSNFDVIARLPIDIIKFDGQLVQNIGTSSKYDLLIAKVCEYAKGNDIRTIAEFVDSEKLLEHIVELGVDYAQGYHISEPLPLQNLDAFGTKKE